MIPLPLVLRDWAMTVLSTSRSARNLRELHARMAEAPGESLRHHFHGRARLVVRENFQVTRHMREYMTLVIGMSPGVRERIELDGRSREGAW